MNQSVGKKKPINFPQTPTISKLKYEKDEKLFEKSIKPNMNFPFSISL
jgi:hypothetical protein